MKRIILMILFLALSGGALPFLADMTLPVLALPDNDKPVRMPKPTTIDADRLRELAEQRKAASKRRKQLEQKKAEAARKAREEKNKAVEEKKTVQKKETEKAKLTAKPRENAPDLVLMLQPFYNRINAGSRILTEATLYSKKTQAFDAVRLCIKHPSQLKPAKIFDYPLAEMLDEKNPPTLKRKNGLLIYEARLTEPVEFNNRLVLVRIVWEATETVRQENLSLSKTCAEKSGVFLNGHDILASNKISNVATIDSTLNFMGTKDFERISSYQPKAAGSIEQQHDNEAISLDMKVNPGLKQGDYIIDVILQNPKGLAFQEVRLNIGFDPQKAQVLDWDEGGWIQRGVNLYDAHAHLQYPFRQHLRNWADNRKGRIIYHMKTDSPADMPSGSLARIYVRTDSKANLQSFDLFAKPTPSGPGVTAIIGNGRNLLKKQPSEKTLASTP